MPEETHTKKLTFNTHLPLGECAHFTHNNQPWIAIPADRHAELRAVTDRLLGACSRTLTQLNTPTPSGQVVAATKIIREAMNIAIATKGPRLTDNAEPSDDEPTPAALTELDQPQQPQKNRNDIIADLLLSLDEVAVIDLQQLVEPSSARLIKYATSGDINIEDAIIELITWALQKLGDLPS